MFGSEYSSQPEILMDSFGDMSDDYKKKIKHKKESSLLLFLQKTYLWIFGIPEIGFQIRSLYFEDIVNAKLLNKKFKKILDAGSGIGTYSFWLAKKFPESKMLGGDVDKNKLSFSVKFAKKLGLENTSFKYFDVTRVSPDKNKYDLIVNIDVLEHIENYEKVLNNFSKQLISGGYLFIHTPQSNQKRIFKALKKWSHEDHLHEGYSPSDLREALHNSGFKIIVLRQTFGFFGKLAWELNHMCFKKGFVVSGLVYPFLYIIACMDLLAPNHDGLGTAILAQKK